MEFEVIYRKDDMTKTIVGENFRKRIIETGTLGGYNVTGGLVKGKIFISYDFCINVG